MGLISTLCRNQGWLRGGGKFMPPTAVCTVTANRYDPTSQAPILIEHAITGRTRGSDGANAAVRRVTTSLIGRFSLERCEWVLISRILAMPRPLRRRNPLQLRTQVL